MLMSNKKKFVSLAHSLNFMYACCISKIDSCIVQKLAMIGSNNVNVVNLVHYYPQSVKFSSLLVIAVLLKTLFAIIVSLLLEVPEAVYN